jgi:hypothetical protein
MVSQKNFAYGEISPATEKFLISSITDEQFWITTTQDGFWVLESSGLLQASHGMR